MDNPIALSPQDQPLVNALTSYARSCAASQVIAGRHGQADALEFAQTYSQL